MLRTMCTHLWRGFKDNEPWLDEVGIDFKQSRPPPPTRHEPQQVSVVVHNTVQLPPWLLEATTFSGVLQGGQLQWISADLLATHCPNMMLPRITRAHSYRKRAVCPKPFLGSAGRGRPAAGMLGQEPPRPAAGGVTKFGKGCLVSVRFGWGQSYGKAPMEAHFPWHKRARRTRRRRPTWATTASRLAAGERLLLQEALPARRSGIQI